MISAASAASAGSAGFFGYFYKIFLDYENIFCRVKSPKNSALAALLYKPTLNVIMYDIIKYVFNNTSLNGD